MIQRQSQPLNLSLRDLRDGNSAQVSSVRDHRSDNLTVVHLLLLLLRRRRLDLNLLHLLMRETCSICKDDTCNEVAAAPLLLIPSPAAAPAAPATPADAGHLFNTYI